MELMASGDFPFGVLGLVHVANAIEQLRPLRADEALDLRVRAENLAEPQARPDGRHRRRGLRGRRARMARPQHLPASRVRGRENGLEGALGRRACAERRVGGAGRHRAPLRRGVGRPQPDPPARPLGAAVRPEGRDRARDVDQGALPRRAAGSPAGGVHGRGRVQAAGPAAREGRVRLVDWRTSERRFAAARRAQRQAAPDGALTPCASAASAA